MEPLFFKMDLCWPRDRVWTAWTTPEGLTGWLCLRAVVEPVVGGAYELFFDPDPAGPEGCSTLCGRVLSVDRPRLLQFSGATASPDSPLSEVKVELFPTPSGTRLEVTHSGWGEGEQWETARAWFERSWYDALERLRLALRKPA